VVAPPDREPAEADVQVSLLYAEHVRGLVRLAWLLVRDQGLAEDIVQDAFVSLHQHWGRLRSPTSATAYLHRSVVNACRSAGRHRGVEARYLARESGRAGGANRWVGPSAEDSAIERASRRDLMAVIDQLPNRQREVIVLRYYAGLTEEEIAHVLDISPGAVKGYAHRAIARLRTTVQATSEQG